MLRPPPKHIPPLGPPKLKPRDKTLALWQGTDAAIRQGAMRKLKSAGEILPQVLKSLRIDQRQSEAEIMRVWRTVLPPDIVATCHPTRLAKGTLFVAVNNAIQLSEIKRFRQREILQRLQYSFGKELIKTVVYVPG